MNLLSLPDEMLASIDKYASSESLMEVRKISSRMDSVARKYQLDKWKTQAIIIKFEGGKFEVSIHFGNPRIKYIVPQNFVTLMEILNYYLPKIRDVKKLGIRSRFSDSDTTLQITTEVGEFLIRKDCKKISSLEIRECKLAIGFDLMRKILTKLKMRRLAINVIFEEFVPSNSLIEGLELDYLILHSHIKKSLINLTCLDGIFAKKLPTRLDLNLSDHTVLELGKFLEKHLKVGVCAVDKWGLDIGIGSMIRIQVILYIRHLKCFNGCSVALTGLFTHCLLLTIKYRNPVNSFPRGIIELRVHFDNIRN